MKLGDILNESLIKFRLEKTNKTDIIVELINLLEPTGALLNKDNVIQAVLDREKIMSTGIGNSVAIPHGKTKDAKAIVVSMGITTEDIDFESLDGKPVRIVFMLVGPEKPPSDHIKMLSRISRLCNPPIFRKKLLEATSSAAILQLIREEESSFDI